MESYVLDWLSLLLRWAHFIVGIAWIGSSFYFVWLDSSLNRPAKDPENERVGGDLWSVHGGGFYHAQKYQVSPAKLPEPLHWFMWEAYSTWLTGFALLVVTYYFKADIYLIDTTVRDLSSGNAIAISVGLLLVGWVLYDGLCRLPFGDFSVALIGFGLLGLLAFGFSEVFSGRGMYMQIGAMLGTMMAANVAMVIIPGQRKTVAAMVAGEEPDPMYGIRAKQRSMHNNYLTLPVLFVMLSSHYPMTYGHGRSWLILVALFVIGASIRHYFNLRNLGRSVLAIPVFVLAALLGLAALIAPKVSNVRVSKPESDKVSIRVVQAIVADRCQICHSKAPNHPTAPCCTEGCDVGQRGTNRTMGRTNSSTNRCQPCYATGEPNHDYRRRKSPNRSLVRWTLVW